MWCWHILSHFMNIYEWVSEWVSINLYSTLLLRTANALDTVISYKQVRFKWMLGTVCVVRWIPDKIREWVPGHRASNCERPTAVSVEPERSAVRQVGDGWRNADAGVCQHWRPGCSAPTDTVVRDRSDTGELSLLAWREPGRERRASAVGHAVSDPGYDQTSVCQR